jgi:hypothetical protein
MLGEDKEQGIKRIRIVAALVAGGLFAMTAVTQFQGELPRYQIFGVLLSAIIGFGFMWVIMTIVKLIMKLIRR